MERDPLVEVYCKAWEQSFKADNPFHTVSMSAQDRKHVSAALKSVLASQYALEQGWQPIETAPRYGRILVAGTEIGTCVASAGWDNDAPDEVRWEVVNGIVVNPTHWMPLPPVPKEKKGSV